jgi:hypothetical protein
MHHNFQSFWTEGKSKLPGKELSLSLLLVEMDTDLDPANDADPTGF